MGLCRQMQGLTPIPWMSLAKRLVHRVLLSLEGAEVPVWTVWDLTGEFLWARIGENFGCTPSAVDTLDEAGLLGGDLLAMPGAFTPVPHYLVYLLTNW